jgi:CBS domain-containing protein
MDEKAPVKVYMSKIIAGVKSDDTVQEACRIMVEFGVDVLAVVDGEDVVGCITQSDVIQKVVIPDLSHNTHVRDVMGRIMKVNANTPLRKVLDIIAKSEVKHVFVEDDGKITGIFSLTDLLEAVRIKKVETVIAME